jgi:hypothetical protein
MRPPHGRKCRPAAIPCARCGNTGVCYVDDFHPDYVVDMLKGPDAHGFLCYLCRLRRLVHLAGVTPSGQAVAATTMISTRLSGRASVD